MEINYYNYKVFESIEKLSYIAKVIVNTTPHDITFGREGSDETFIVQPSGIILNAKAVEKEIYDDIVKTEFAPTPEGIQLIHDIHEWFETTFDIEEYDLRIVGSIIAVNAYKPYVVGLTPLKGFERVPPNEKRMNIDKFTIA